ncbi:MAG TPA: hypothetical protein VKA84_14835 [Gemmatimonadaceae bacterium]|nr:hypothetical protein [Gemmatimonadaceae bacterium]
MHVSRSMNGWWWISPPNALPAIRALAVVAATAAAVAATPVVSTAQTDQVNIKPGREAANAARLEAAKRSRGFDLFALRDAAVSGMRMAGQIGFGVTNYGPCLSDGFGLAANCGVGANAGTNALARKWFQIDLLAGTPLSDFRKIRNVYPEIGSNAIGGGYSSLMNGALVSAPFKWGPADNTTGTLFRGVAATSDATCLNHRGSTRNGQVTVGATLLAGLDCPATWPLVNGVPTFLGARQLSDVAFDSLQADQGSQFHFDWWRIPERLRDQKFLGDFQTYGITSDHYAEILRGYGAVTPRGTGAPTVTGYPLGLEWHWQAFSFTNPQIANVMFWQATIINRSADVYGQGISYDSLYVGLALGPTLASQWPATYFDPARSTAFSTPRCVNPNCNNATAFPNLWGTGRESHANGENAVIVLKSPIGDLRNKLLTRPGRFNDPTSPFRDDTITFNVGRLCEYGDCSFDSYFATERRGFGMISSTAANVLDGRKMTDLDDYTSWSLFRNVDYPGKDSTFSRYVPGNWHWEGSPATQDTIYYTNCSTFGCVPIWGDSLPGGAVNGGGQYALPVTAGPIHLGAGDTTGFFFAVTFSQDSAGILTNVQNATDAYLSFFLGPQPVPAPRITSTEVNAGETGDPYVRLYFDATSTSFVDPFLLKFAQDVKNSTAPAFVALRTLNPTLSADIEARARDNLQEILLFKSCDNGTTFTANDGDCIGNPATALTGAAFSPPAWVPYAVLARQANGTFQSTVRDNNVVPGRTYLYSLATRSRGFQQAIQDIDPADPLCATSPPPATCKKIFRVLKLADTTFSSVPRASGPSSAIVYVPVTLPAGSQPATVAVTPVSGNPTVPITIRLSNTARAGTYEATAFNRFRLRVDSVPTKGTAKYTLVAQRAATNAIIAGGSTTAGVVVVDSVVFTDLTPIPLAGLSYTSLFVPANRTVVAGTDTVRYELTTASLGVVVSQAGRALFASTTLTTDATTPPTFLDRPDFPGFTLLIDQAAATAAPTEAVLLPGNDTLNANVVASGGINLIQGSIRRGTGISGRYEFRFVEDPFGLDPAAQQFVYDPNNPAAIRQAIHDSLETRRVATTADTTDALRTIIAATADDSVKKLLTQGAKLVPARLPFVVVNSTTNKPARVAMLRRTDYGKLNRVLIGSGNDTLSVPVQEDVWVPGDELILVEDVQVDSTGPGGVQVVTQTTVNGVVTRRIAVDTVQRVTFSGLMLGCDAPTNCNPLRIQTVGATGYYPYPNGTVVVADYLTPVGVGNRATFTITGATTPSTVATHSQLSDIRVVPNPFVVQSFFDEVNARTGDPRVLFTSVPSRGTLRVYSVAGAFLQQLSWTEADLIRNRDERQPGLVVGDLPYNLRTREGTDLASGLYIYVINATDSDGKQITARGKFVIIR